MRRIAVVGASLAGLRACEALRREGFTGELLLIGDEPTLPYDRPPLSKQFLTGSMGEERIALCTAERARELVLTPMLGVRAEALELRDRVLVLGNGRRERYDGLVIATGAAPRRLPFGHELAGVHVLRSLADARALRDALSARPRVCIVGGGFIGLEVAASCRTLGLGVHVLEAEPLPLASKLGASMAAHVVALHRERGVELSLGVTLRAIEGDGRVERAVLSDGRRLEADLVVVGIGVQPNVAWLEGSGIALRDGVLCDATCAASAPDVVAAGDCARWTSPRVGDALRVEHWTHAVEMGSHAARRLLGGAAFSEAFSPVPYFWTDQYERKLQVAGHVRADDELCVIEGPTPEGKLLALYGRAGQLSGVLAIGRPAQLARGRKLIADGASFADARRSFG
jgi:NADPH-dependent 2,4-dienoyl-CoA reductase/sulfur reductase-like enzyme